MQLGSLFPAFVHPFVWHFDVSCIVRMRISFYILFHLFHFLVLLCVRTEEREKKHNISMHCWNWLSKNVRIFDVGNYFNRFVYCNYVLVSTQANEIIFLISSFFFLSRNEPDPYASVQENLNSVQLLIIHFHLNLRLYRDTEQFLQNRYLNCNSKFWQVHFGFVCISNIRQMAIYCLQHQNAQTVCVTKEINKNKMQLNSFFRFEIQFERDALFYFFIAFSLNDEPLILLSNLVSNIYFVNEKKKCFFCGNCRQCNLLREFHDRNEIYFEFRMLKVNVCLVRFVSFTNYIPHIN